MSGAATAPILYSATVSSPVLGAAEPKNAKDKAHHLTNGKGFTNPWPSWKMMTPMQIIPEMLWRLMTGAGNNPDTKPPNTVNVVKPEFLPSRSTSSLRATWLGHACYLVEFPGGLRVLFDPVFEPRCSPFSFMGPKRYTKIPCEISEIPLVDAVVISHNHYDHLSYPTITELAKRHRNAQFFVPLGNEKWFNSCGIKNVTEMDWWEQRELRLARADSKAEEGASKVSSEGGTTKGDPEDIVATIGCLPCQHITGRGLRDRGHTLWASWSIESGGKKVWFAGDTGYRTVPKIKDQMKDYDDSHASLPVCPAFAEIGEHRGPFDLGLIPIGAYDPRWIMSPMHANPKDSVNIFLETKCKRALGMHWGTWILTEEDVLEPPRLLKEALKWKGVDETGVFDVVDCGASKVFE